MPRLSASHSLRGEPSFCSAPRAAAVPDALRVSRLSDSSGAESRRLLRSRWPVLSAGCVEGDRGTDERLEGARVDLLPLMDVNRAPYLPVEARVEELGRVLQRSPLGEGQLHNRLVRLASADDAVVRPHRSAQIRRLHPLHLLEDVRVCLFDELAHPAQSLPPPVPKLDDSFVNQLKCRVALGRTRLFHALLLELPDSSRMPSNGEGGIRTHEAALTAHAISSRAP